MNDQEWYGIGLDTSQLKRDAQSVRNEFTQIGNTAYNEGMRIDRTFQNLYQGAIAYLSVQQLSLYANQIIQIRGEFQQLGIAFETMLGSKERADQLMSEAIYFAAKTPFTLTDVAGNIKQLMAMGIATENVMDTMKALGDVAAGVSVPISRLAVNYGQVATLGKLQTREIRDFAMAGVPLIDELAKNLGKTRAEIDNMVEEGVIGFSEVEKAFQSMTSEGGKFNNLMEKQNKSVTGQISNIKDKIQVAVNQIGQANEGLIYSGIEGVNMLVSNYEVIGKTLVGLVATYGTYKAALITVAALEGVVASSKSAMLYLEMAAGLGTVTTAHRARAVAMGIEAKAQAALNAVMAVNPYVMLATLVVGAAAAIWILHDSTTAQEKAQKRLNDELEEARTKKANLISKSNELISVIDDETSTIYEQIKAYKELQKQFPELFENMNLEEFKALPANEKKIKINVEVDKQELQNFESEYTATAERIRRLQQQYDFSSGVAYQNGSELLRLSKRIEDEKALLQLQKEQLENARKIREEAEFQAKPNDEKLAFYNSELESLKKQREEIEQIILKSEVLTGEWGNFGVQSILNAQKLDSINKKIDETSKKIGALNGDKSRVQNKSYWEDQKKEAESALDAMTASQRGTKEWNDNLAKLQQARNKLKIWDFSDKAKDAAIKLEEDKLKALAELAEQELELKRNLEQSKVESLKEGYAKQREQARIAYENELADIEKQGKAYLKKLNESKGLKITDKGYITQLPEEVQVNLNTQKKNAEIKYNGELVEINKSAVAEIKDIWKTANEDFISGVEKEKQAINEKYDSLIKKAKELGLNQNLIAELEQKRSASLSKVVAIDWIDTFGDLDRLSTDMLKNMRDKLKQYITELSGTLNKSELNDIVNAFEEIDKAISQRSPFSTAIDSAKEYSYQTKKIEALKEQLKYYKEQKADLLVITRIEQRINQAEKDRAESLSKFNQSLNEIGRQGGDIVSAIGEFTDMLEKYGVSVGEQGKEIQRGIEQMFGSLESLDLTKPGTIITSAIKYITGLGNTLGAIFGYGRDTALSDDNFNRYEKLMSVMDELISKQKELIDSMAGSDAVDASEAAIQILKNKVDATKSLGLDYLNSREKNEHTFGVKLQESLKKYVSDFNNLVEKGINWDLIKGSGRMEGLFNLTHEQLQTIKEEIPEAWANIDEKTREYLQTLIDSGDEIDEINNKLKETLTGLSFDSAKDSLREFLSTADSSMEDVANNFQEYMRNALVKIATDKVFAQRMQEWYDTFASYMTDNVLNDNERGTLQGLYEGIFKDAEAWRDNMFAAAGISFDKNKGYNELTGSKIGATEESVSALFGGITAMRIDLKGIGTDIIAIDENTRQATDYLMKGLVVWERIAENTSYNKNLVPIYDELQKINKTLIEKLS